MVAAIEKTANPYLVINTITNLTRSVDGHRIERVQRELSSLSFGIVQQRDDPYANEPRRIAPPVAVSLLRRERRRKKKIERSGENRVDALSEVNKKKKKKKGRGEAARWLRWSSNARTKGRRLSSAWTFHDGTSNGDARSSSCSLSFVLLLFRLLGSIIPRFRREPDAPLAKIRR